MKPKLSYPLFLVSLICQPLFAEPAVRLTVDPFISHNFGYTEYIMEWSGYLATPIDTGLYFLKSELEFPLDVIMLGAKIGLHSTKETLYAWSIEAGYCTNLDDPGGIMKDHDWETVKRVIDGETVYYWGQVEKFSYTESSADMKSTQLTLEGFLRVMHKTSFSLDLWGGFRYQKIEQNIAGYQGWQLLRDSAVAREITVYSSEPALFYWVTYKSPFLGLRSGFKLGTKVQFAAQAAFAPVWVSDYDDHLIRNKIATASITGSGLISGASIHFDLANPATFKPTVSLTSDLVYLHASGNQTQKWYGDDPLTEEDDTGTVLPGIPHDINTLQLNVGLRVSMIF
ncbi:MAG: omptin family outer membrane protease [Candidatus Zixiibacteriota bacterium]